ncbi:predicted protein [Lichtheimia corymbifera JMRC:FSU:9682]|uniref:Uncharacterized protein n=1 Tax=Lichtheimia corymbifera JMRC:FSU:9682 TaxID=1263082 RepID=A0A068RKJ7_9FUNG|nr:predicted protein [Lichtheimia corymbifera JMRC:FSU:9682]
MKLIICTIGQGRVACLHLVYRSTDDNEGGRANQPIIVPDHLQSSFLPTSFTLRYTTQKDLIAALTETKTTL